jgi:hypothetical protein
MAMKKSLMVLFVAMGMGCTVIAHCRTANGMTEVAKEWDNHVYSTEWVSTQGPEGYKRIFSDYLVDGVPTSYRDVPVDHIDAVDAKRLRKISK